MRDKMNFDGNKPQNRESELSECQGRSLGSRFAQRKVTDLKDSGIAWIGEMPKDWEVKPFKAIYSLGKGLTITKADLVEKGFSVISYGQIHSKSNNGTSIKNDLIRYVPSIFIENNKNCLVNYGDVIFADTSEDLEGCGNSIFIDRDMILFAGYHTIIAFNKSNYKNKYFPYLFKTDSWRTQIRTIVNGVKLYSIPQKTLSSTYIIVPSLHEQKAIADFLDRKCDEIDELVSLQDKMIEELNAYKQSIISETVTRGLNPDVPLKDSGIEWIGEIPEHWKNIRLRNLCEIATGDKDTVMKVDDGLYPFFVRSPKVERINEYSFDTEAILMAGDGVGAGKVFHYYNGKFGCHQRVYCLFNFSELIVPHFLLFFMTYKFQELFVGLSAKSTVDSVRLPMLKDFIITIPPLAEQQDIADYLDKKCAEIDSLISLKQIKIEELKEYKKSLIYEYVTGKKSVEL